MGNYQPQKLDRTTTFSNLGEILENGCKHRRLNMGYSRRIIRTTRLLFFAFIKIWVISVVIFFIEFQLYKFSMPGVNWYIFKIFAVSAVLGCYAAHCGRRLASRRHSTARSVSFFNYMVGVR